MTENLISSNLVDALPYVDAGYDAPGVREAVLELVEQEMKSHHPSKNYLEHLPPMDLHAFQTDILASECKRLDANLPAPEKLDFKKYQQTKPPANRRRDPAAWEECFNRAAVLHNYMVNRLVNLQLQAEYGSEVWRRYIPALQRQVKLADQELKDIRNRIQEINWDRKNMQLKAGQKLEYLENSWVNLVGKNFDIERTCLEMEARLEELERLQASKIANKKPAANEENLKPNPVAAEEICITTGATTTNVADQTQEISPQALQLTRGVAAETGVADQEEEIGPMPSAPMLQNDSSAPAV